MKIKIVMEWTLENKYDEIIWIVVGPIVSLLLFIFVIHTSEIQQIYIIWEAPREFQWFNGMLLPQNYVLQRSHMQESPYCGTIYKKSEVQSTRPM